MSDERRLCWGFLRRRTCVVPTWRGWLALTVATAVLALLLLKTVHPFLAASDPVPSRVLVVEGWLADCALEAAIAEFQRGSYDKLFVTGFPLEKGAPLSEYRTYAELGAATVVKLGLASSLVQAVPAPDARRDRTYASALALRKWLREQHAGPTSLNVISVGAHSRRTRLLFEKAFGDETRIGVFAVEPRDYDPRRWWASSYGFRAVTDELVAYAYARVLFRPKEP